MPVGAARRGDPRPPEPSCDEAASADRPAARARHRRAGDDGDSLAGSVDEVFPGEKFEEPFQGEKQRGSSDVGGTASVERRRRQSCRPPALVPLGPSSATPGDDRAPQGERGSLQTSVTADDLRVAAVDVAGHAAAPARRGGAPGSPTTTADASLPHKTYSGSQPQPSPRRERAPEDRRSLLMSVSKVGEQGRRALQGIVPGIAPKGAKRGSAWQSAARVASRAIRGTAARLSALLRRVTAFICPSVAVKEPPLVRWGCRHPLEPMLISACSSAVAVARLWWIGWTLLGALLCAAALCSLLMHQDGERRRWLHLSRVCPLAAPLPFFFAAWLRVVPGLLRHLFIAPCFVAVVWCVRACGPPGTFPYEKYHLVLHWALAAFYTTVAFSADAGAAHY